MPEKQDRYRDRTAEKGFRRVEVLIPEGSVNHLKAYARALRDAHVLNVALPGFEGMRSISEPPTGPGPPEPVGRAEAGIAPDRAAGRQAPGSQPEGQKGKPKPDFSGGLF